MRHDTGVKKVWATLLGSALLAGCSDRPATTALEAAVAEMGASLPTPYRDGLVTESAQARGNTLVLQVRFPEATYAMAVAKPEVFNALRVDEQDAMRELCRVAVLKPLLDAGGGVHRRFVDAEGALFFETTLAAADCTSL